MLSINVEVIPKAGSKTERSNKNPQTSSWTLQAIVSMLKANVNDGKITKKDPASKICLERLKKKPIQYFYKAWNWKIGPE